MIFCSFIYISLKIEDIADFIIMNTTMTEEINLSVVSIIFSILKI